MGITKIIQLAIFLFSSIFFAQNLEEYRWKNRLLIVQSNDKNNIDYQNQLKEFKNVKTDFDERKLILFKLENNKYKKMNFSTKNPNESWMNSTLSKKHKLKQNESFKILLIGLDGGIKRNQNKVLKKTDLYNLIDSMPMRAAELQNGH